MAYTLGFKDFYEEVEGDIKETGTSSTLEVPISKEEWKCLNKTQRKKRVLEEWNKIDDNEKDEFERIAQKIDEERIWFDKHKNNPYLQHFLKEVKTDEEIRIFNRELSEILINDGKIKDFIKESTDRMYKSIIYHLILEKQIFCYDVNYDKDMVLNLNLEIIKLLKNHIEI